MHPRGEAEGIDGAARKKEREKDGARQKARQDGACPLAPDRRRVYRWHLQEKEEKRKEKRKRLKSLKKKNYIYIYGAWG